MQWTQEKYTTKMQRTAAEIFGEMLQLMVRKFLAVLLANVRKMSAFLLH